MGPSGEFWNGRHVGLLGNWESVNGKLDAVEIESSQGGKF